MDKRGTFNGPCSIFDVLEMNLEAEGYDLDDNLPVDRDPWTRNTPTLRTNNQLFCR